MKWYKQPVVLAAIIAAVATVVVEILKWHQPEQSIQPAKMSISNDPVIKVEVNTPAAGSPRPQESVANPVKRQPGAAQSEKTSDSTIVCFGNVNSQALSEIRTLVRSHELSNGELHFQIHIESSYGGFIKLIKYDPTTRKELASTSYMNPANLDAIRMRCAEFFSKE